MTYFNSIRYALVTDSNQGEAPTFKISYILVLAYDSMCHDFVASFSNRGGSVFVSFVEGARGVVVPSSQNSRSPSALKVPFFKTCPFSLRISSSVILLSENI